MKHKVVTGNNDDRRSIDDSKITGGIPSYFDKKVVSDEELVDLAIEVNNVKNGKCLLSRKSNGHQDASPR